MLTLWKEFDDLFADNNTMRWPVTRNAAPTFMPPVDIQETKESYLLRADVPGVAEKDLDISVKDNVLTLKGERHHEERTSESGYHRVERSFGTFQRTFVLPKGVKAESIEARVENGQLTITVPKPVAALPRKINVQIGGASSGPELEEKTEQKAS